MTPHYLRAQLPGSQRSGRLKIAIETSTGTISSVLGFQSSPKLFSEPLLCIYKLHLYIFLQQEHHKFQKLTDHIKKQSKQ